MKCDMGKYEQLRFLYSVYFFSLSFLVESALHPVVATASYNFEIGYGSHCFQEIRAEICSRNICK